MSLHTQFITNESNANLHIFGSNCLGQANPWQGQEDYLQIDIPINPTNKCVQVQTGYQHTQFITENGDLYTSLLDFDTSQRCTFSNKLQENIIFVNCHYEGTLFIDQNNNLYGYPRHISDYISGDQDLITDPSVPIRENTKMVQCDYLQIGIIDIDNILYISGISDIGGPPFENPDFDMPFTNVNVKYVTQDSQNKNSYVQYITEDNELYCTQGLYMACDWDTQGDIPYYPLGDSYQPIFIPVTNQSVLDVSISCNDSLLYITEDFVLYDILDTSTPLTTSQVKSVSHDYDYTHDRIQKIQYLDLQNNLYIYGENENCCIDPNIENDESISVYDLLPLRTNVQQIQNKLPISSYQIQPVILELQQTNITSDSMDITFILINSTQYDIYFRNTSKQTYIKISEGEGDSLKSINVSNLSQNTVYDFYVIQYNNIENYIPSKMQSGVIIQSTVQYIVDFVILRPTENEYIYVNESYTITWSQLSDLTEIYYNIYINDTKMNSSPLQITEYEFEFSEVIDYKIQVTMFNDGTIEDESLLNNVQYYIIKKEQLIYRINTQIELYCTYGEYPGTEICTNNVSIMGKDQNPTHSIENYPIIIPKYGSLITSYERIFRIKIVQFQSNFRLKNFKIYQYNNEPQPGCLLFYRILTHYETPKFYNVLNWQTENNYEIIPNYDEQYNNISINGEIDSYVDQQNTYTDYISILLEVQPNQLNLSNIYLYLSYDEQNV